GHVVDQHSGLGSDVEVRPVACLALDVPDRQADRLAVDAELLRGDIDAQRDVAGLAELSLGILADQRGLPDVTFTADDHLEGAHGCVPIVEDKGCAATHNPSPEYRRRPDRGSTVRLSW